MSSGLELLKMKCLQKTGSWPHQEPILKNGNRAKEGRIISHELDPCRNTLKNDF